MGKSNLVEIQKILIMVPIRAKLRANQQGSITGCSQAGEPKWGFVMGSRTQGVQEILEKYIYLGCPHPHTSDLGNGTNGAEPLSTVLNSNTFAYNLLNSHLTYL